MLLSLIIYSNIFSTLFMKLSATSTRYPFRMIVLLTALSIQLFFGRAVDNVPADSDSLESGHFSFAAFFGFLFRFLGLGLPGLFFSSFYSLCCLSFMFFFSSLYFFRLSFSSFSSCFFFSFSSISLRESELVNSLARGRGFFGPVGVIVVGSVRYFDKKELLCVLPLVELETSVKSDEPFSLSFFDVRN